MRGDRAKSDGRGVRRTSPRCSPVALCPIAPDPLRVARREIAPHPSLVASFCGVTTLFIRTRPDRRRVVTCSSARPSCSCTKAMRLPGYRKRPRLAVFPGTRDEAIAVVRALHRARVPFVPRGAGTGLSGGALADDIVLVGLQRMRRIISIDAASRSAVVEPGVVNSILTKAATPFGLHYAPDPSSQTRVHDRRQRRRERGRAALPQVRRHAQSRARRERRASRRRRGPRSSAPATATPATTCSARTSARRAASA